MRRGEVGGGGAERGGDREKGNIKEDSQYNGEKFHRRKFAILLLCGLNFAILFKISLVPFR